MCPRVAIVVALALLAAPLELRAHGIVGKRLFIEPLVTEDANPKSELDFPVFESIHAPEGHVSTFGYSFEKKITRRFSLSFENSYNWFTPNGKPGISGFGNVGFGAKYSLFTSAAHEFTVSSALDVEVPTGDSAIGADPYTTITPGLLYAKGLGDLPAAGLVRWLRPLALQGDFTLDLPVGGPQTPDRGRIPHADLVLEYSFPYLNAYIRHANAGFSLGEGGFRKGFSPRAILGDLFPFVEFNFASVPYQGGHRAFGFYRPGVVYVGSYFGQ